MKSYFNKPKWNFYWNWNWNEYKYLYFQKSYGLNMPYWKDKYNTPRCELSPYIIITILGLRLYIEKGSDSYWERWLWIHKYHGGNEKKARETWPWENYITKKSSWFIK